MSRRPNDIIGAIAGAVLVIVLVTAALGGIALAQAQDAIDAAVAERQSLACFQHAQMCAAVEARK